MSVIPGDESNNEKLERAGQKSEVSKVTAAGFSQEPVPKEILEQANTAGEVAKERVTKISNVIYASFSQKGLEPEVVKSKNEHDSKDQSFAGKYMRSQENKPSNGMGSPS